MKSRIDKYALLIGAIVFLLSLALLLYLINTKARIN